MRKFNFLIRFVDVATGNYWDEAHECRAWTYEKAVTKALRRGQTVLRCLNNSNKNIYFRVCKMGWG